MVIKKVNLLKLFILVLPLFLLTGCLNRGVSKGFGYQTRIPPILCAVKSKTTDFDDDNIKFDFYYGLPENGGLTYVDNNEEDNVNVGVALYFYNHQPPRYEKVYYNDYHHIEDHYFIKMIPADEFLSDDYSVRIKWYSGKTFRHHEKIRVPKEVLSYPSGTLTFQVVEVIYSQEHNGYFLNYQDFVSLDYKYIDENTVRFMD